MKPQDYLVTTEQPGRPAQKRVWNSARPFPIDHPTHYILERDGTGLWVRGLPKANDGKKVSRVALDSAAAQKGIVLKFSSPRHADKEPLRIKVKVVPLQRIPPAFLPQHNVQVQGSDLIYSYVLFQGVGDTLQGSRDADFKMKVRLWNQHAFTLTFANEAVQITSHTEGIEFVSDSGERILFSYDTTKELPIDRFVIGELRYGSYWWRLTPVPIPDELSSELYLKLSARDGKWFRAMMASILAVFVILLSVMPEVPKEPPKPPAIQTEIHLKLPHIAPLIKPQEIVKPLPRPKPKHKHIIELKPHHKKEVRLKPRVQPRHEAPPPRQQRAAREPARHKAAPVPAVSIATRKVAEQNAELSHSLSFLTTSSKRRSLAGATQNEALANKAASDYDARTRLNPLSKTSNALNKLAKRSEQSEGPITTTGSHGLVDTEAQGDQRSRASRGVRGKVALNALSRGRIGASLGGGSLSVSGPGQVADGAIEKALEKHLSQFQYCYEKALLENSSLAGSVTLEWTISGSGSASGAKVVRSELDNQGLNRCLTRVVSRIHFPAPTGGEVTVRYPFSFSSSNL